MARRADSDFQEVSGEASEALIKFGARAGVAGFVAADEVWADELWASVGHAGLAVDLSQRTGEAVLVADRADPVLKESSGNAAGALSRADGRACAGETALVAAHGELEVEVGRTGCAVIDERPVAGLAARIAAVSSGDEVGRLTRGALAD